MKLNKIPNPITLIDFIKIEGVIKDTTINFNHIIDGHEKMSIGVLHDSFDNDKCLWFDSFDEFEDFIYKHYEGDIYRQLKQVIKLAKLKFKKL